MLARDPCPSRPAHVTKSGLYPVGFGGRPIGLMVSIFSPSRSIVFTTKALQASSLRTAGCVRGDAGPAVDNVAVASNRLGQSLSSIECLAGLAKQLNAAAVIDSVFGLDSVPEGISVGTERPGWGNTDGFACDDRKGRFLRAFWPVPRRLMFYA